MKKFEVNVDINGTFTFEVEAKNRNDAEKKVNDLLSDVSVKEALENYKNNIVLNQRIKQEKIMER